MRKNKRWRETLVMCPLYQVIHVFLSLRRHILVFFTMLLPLLSAICSTLFACSHLVAQLVGYGSVLTCQTDKKQRLSAILTKVASLLRENGHFVKTLPYSLLV